MYEAILMFIDMFTNKVKEEGFNGTAYKLLEHKEEMIQYFLKNNWTKADMKQEWHTDE
jgi:hypothetical protein